MDRNKLWGSTYAGMTSQIVSDIYKRKNEQKTTAYLEYINNKKKQEETNRKQLEYSKKPTYVTKEPEKGSLSKERATNNSTGNLPWEPNNELPNTISRVGSTGDNRKKKNDFASFLDETRNKMYDSVSQKYVDKPFFVEMAEMRHDPKSQKYMEMTNAIKAKDIALNKLMLAAKDYTNSLKPDDYGWDDWASDAYSAYRISLHEGKRGDYEGLRIRSLEIDDIANRAKEYTNRQIQLQDIQSFNNAVSQLDNARNVKSEKSNEIIRAAQLKLNNSLQQLKKYYGRNFDPYNNKQDANKLQQYESDLRSNTEGRDDIFTLRDLARSHGDMLTVTARALILPVSDLLLKLGITNNDIGRDAVENDTFKTLVDLNIEDPRKRLVQLNNYFNRSKKTKLDLDAKKIELDREINQIAKPSEYFTNKAQLGSLRMQNGESWWNKDNLFYTLVQQQGFSNSSWGCQLASMGLTTAGSFLNDTGIGAIAGVPMVMAGAGFQYEAARAENNDDVVENAKQRVAKALKGEYTHGVNYYDRIIKNAKTLKRYQGKTEDDILGDIVSGRLYVTSKVNDAITQAITDEIVAARQGANNLYDKDMAAVASDAATDAIVWGTSGVPKFMSGVKGIAGYTGKKIGGKLLGAAEKRLNESVKYRFARRAVKDAAHSIATSQPVVDAAILGDKLASSKLVLGSKDVAKYVWTRGGSPETYAKWLGQGGYVVGALTKPLVAGAEKAFEKAKETEWGHKILTSDPVVQTALLADEGVEFAKAIPNVLLKKAGKLGSKIPGVSEFEAQQFAKRSAAKIGNIVPSSFSEEIEEGKQYLNGQEWVNNADPDQVSKTLDITFEDLSKLMKLMPAALGVPFGQRWGLAAKYSDLFENMAGGMFGGFMHNATMTAAKDLLGEASYFTGLQTSKRSIDHMIATNAYLDNKSTIGRLETAQLLSEKIGKANISNVLQELLLFQEFNNKQRDNGEDAIDQELIDEQRNFILKVNGNYNSKDTENQAEKAGIKKDSDDYNIFVAAKTIYQEVLNDAKLVYNDAVKNINSFLNQIQGPESFDEDDILESTVGATGNTTSENPLLTLFKESPEEVEDKMMTRRERKKAKRAANKAKRLAKRRQKLIEKGGSEEIANEIELNSVANEEQTSVSQTFDKRATIRAASKYVTELLALTDYLDSFTNISDYSQTNNKNDINYIKLLILKRIDHLKKILPEDKVKHILNNREVYLQHIKNADELMEGYRTLMAANIDLDTANMMNRLLVGIKAEGSEEKNPWRVGKTQDVLKKIQECIDDKYALIDRVNREFQERNYQSNNNAIVNIEAEAADEELDQMFRSEEQNNPSDYLGSEESALDQMRDLQEDDEQNRRDYLQEQQLNQPSLPQQLVLPEEPKPLSVNSEDVQGIQSIEDMIKQQEEAAARAAIDQERENLNQAYKQKLAKENDADVVESEDELLTATITKNKVIVYDRNSKDYQIYNVQSAGNIVDEDGIYIVKDGKLIPEDQRKRSEEQLSKTITEAQQKALDTLEEQIKLDNEKVVGVTGHDYFIKEDDGTVHMYPRVHTVKGDQYADAPEMDKTYPESEYNKNLKKIQDYIEKNDLDGLKELIKSIDNYDLYLDQIRKNKSDSINKYVADALAVLMTLKAGVGVNVGQVCDELTRIFFDPHTSEPFEYETLQVNIGFDKKTYPISTLMSLDTFNSLKEDLINLQKKYDEDGYVLSTTRHTWHGHILVNGQYINIAGETDIVAIDRDGKFHIIDTKTSKYSFKEGAPKFDGLGDLFGRSAKRTTREDYALQLSYYMAIIKSAMPQVLFAENPIELLPLIVHYDMNAMERTIEDLKNGKMPSYIPIDNISNGHNEEPDRVILTPVLDIINGIFDDKKDLHDKQLKISDRKDSLVQQLAEVGSDCEEKIKALIEHHPSLANVLDSVKVKITQLLNDIKDPHDLLKNELNGADLDAISTVLNQIDEQLQQVKEDLELIYSTNITKLFNQQYEASSEELDADSEFHRIEDGITDETPTFEDIRPEEPSPTPSYEDDEKNKDSWYNYNTADRWNVDSTVSDDKDKIKLNSVTGNEDFATNSVTEVKSIEQDHGTTIVVCDITYDNHTYRNVKIQIAKNQNGQKLLEQVRQSMAMAHNGQKVVLTGMDRTAGKVNVVQDTNIINVSAIVGDKSIYDLSTEHTQTQFGLGKVDKSGMVEVHAQGAAKGTTSVIYRFEKGKGTSGSYYVIIKPKHHNATIPTKPLCMPIYGSRLEDNDINFLVDLLASVGRYNNPNNPYTHISSEGEFNLPFTYKDLIEFFLPYGSVQSYNKARHVEVKGSNVIFTEYMSDGVNISQTSFDMNTQLSDLKAYIKLNIRMNLDEDKINSRLGLSDGNTPNHPFKLMARFFYIHPNMSELQLGKSKIVFRRNDFVRPDGNKDGISGLGWMARNGMIITNYGGIENPRFSYTDVLTVDSSSSTVQAVDPETVIDTNNPEFTPEDTDNYDDVDFDIDDIDLEHVLNTNNPDNISKNAKLKLHRLFGSRVNVQVAAKLTDIFRDHKFSAGAVGAVVKGAIGLQTNAERGTEYHEAFHLVSRYLLPLKLRKKFYKYIELIINRDEDSGTLDRLTKEANERKKLNDTSAKEYVLEEYGAELCRKYFNDVENVDFSIRKIFDYIGDNSKAFREIGDWRLATLFVAMRIGTFRLPGLRLSEKQKQLSEEWMSQPTYNRNGVSYHHIMNDCMYDSLIRSIGYYIIKLQKVSPDGQGLLNLNLNESALDEKIVKVHRKNGKEDSFTIREAILVSSMIKDANGKKVETPVTQALRELLDNYGETKKQLKLFTDQIGIDYHEKEESERENAMVTGEDSEPGGGNSDHNYDKASYEKSKITRATIGIKFYTSLIKANGKIVDKVNPKTGEKYKTVEYGKNEFGLYEFMDQKDVLVTILHKLHKVKSKELMMDEIRKLAQSDPLFFQLNEYLSIKEKKSKKKDGSTDYTQEQILTQFFNLVSSSKNNFMRVEARRDPKTNKYNISLSTCGQDYEASQYRMEWGRMLTYGGTELFDRDKNGNIVTKLIGNYSGVEYLGAMFDRLDLIRQEFSTMQIENLMDHGKPNLNLINPKTGKRELCNVTTEDGCNIVIDTVCSIFNRMGIQFDAPEFRYMLSEKYGTQGFTTVQSQLQLFFNQSGKESIEQLWGSSRKLIIKNSQTGKWKLNVSDNKIIANKPSDNIPVENLFHGNSFVSELSSWKYNYQHNTTDLSVLIGGGKTYYQISENNLITDVTDDLATGGNIIDDLSKFVYNYMNVSGQDSEGNQVNHIIGGVILKQAIAAKEKGVELPIQVNTLTQFKTNDSQDDGSGYFEIGEREDYISKCSILEQGGLIFPTMSDKKTWVYLSGINIPGLKYHDGIVDNLDSDDVLRQLVEYADLERASVAQTIELLKTLPKHKWITNFHKGATVKDKDGVKHTVANGTIFGALTGIRDENGNFISFSNQLDKNGKYITPDLNLAKADELFFSKTQEEKMLILKRTLDLRIRKEMDHLTSIGLIKKTTQGDYTNEGLNDQALEAIARVKFNLKNTDAVNEFQKNLCIEDYVRDIVSKSIISIHEVERCYSGHPGFFKYKFDKQGRLENRHEDEFKRFGGLISTGTNNNTDIEGLPKDGYTCAVVNNEMIQSPLIEYITNIIATSEWKAALRQYLIKNVISKSKRKEICKRVSLMELKDVRDELYKLSPTAYNIVESKVKSETDSYRLNKDEDLEGIDVADGGAYISPEMTKWLLQMCGEYNNQVDKAFKILMNSDKYDATSVSDAYSLVATKVIGAQKYTAYGQRLSSDNKLMIPYYNKMALFPVFKCMAAGRFAKIYQLMLNNKDENGNPNPIHMLMIKSAIKLGDEGAVDYTTDDEKFDGFNTYKQDFKYLRKQFNTNPHHKEDQSMGTQMVKVALTSLIKDKEYLMPGGDIKTGELLLSDIMSNINKLTEIGKTEFRKKVYNEDGQIDQKKLSEYLIDQLSSRDADRSMIDALQAIEIKDSENNTIGWKLKHPLAAISRMGWLQSVLKAGIDKEMVEIHTYGNAFYQRSVWGMEGLGASYVSDENIANDINDGKELKMIVEDGPAKGAMECVLTMDYFADILKEAGLDKATFSEQRKALIDAGIIGPNAKTNLIGYRIPTQALSSIHALVCRDVVPVLNHNIILPKEFTKITGSDFDIDKIFIASLNYKMEKKDGKWTSVSTFDDGSKKQIQNNLILSYIRLLTDEDGMHIANRSIDNDTQLITNVLNELEKDLNAKKEFEPVDAYDFYTLSKHTSTKLNFLTGKTGIGPFALNNNSLILTTLYNVEFNGSSFMAILGRTSLHDQNDMDGQSIMSWISALINAHVDIAKDPYISRLNVNEMTYNLVNLMIRTGYGKRTFYFTKQPAMLKMADKYRQAQGSFLQDTRRSKWEIRNEAKKDGIVELIGQATFDQITKFLKVTNDKPLGNISKFAEDLLEDKDLILFKIAKGDIQINSRSTYNIGGFMFTPAQIQVLVYYTDKAMEKSAQALSDLVKYSKIDTKKQGKNVSEQLAYLNGVGRVFNDNSIAENLFGHTDIRNITNVKDDTLSELEHRSDEIGKQIYEYEQLLDSTEDEQERNRIESEIEDLRGEHMMVIDQIRDEFDATSTSEFSSSIRRMYKDSFIEHKTREAIRLFMGVMDGQVFEATPGFQNLVGRLCNYFNKQDKDSILDIVQAVTAKIKAEAINEYADKMGIDIHGLVSGNNTIYDRLNSIKIRLKSDPEYADIANNPLLNLLIADKNWTYDYTKYTNNVIDRFSNLKFVRLFDALDKTSSKTDYIISAWDLLLQSNKHPEIRDFARDLCVYAFVTSGDRGGRTKLFNYVPNSFREDSGYVKYIEDLLNEMKNPIYGKDKFNDEFIDDIVLNNQDSGTFVKYIDHTNSHWKEGLVKWESVVVNDNMYIGKDINGNDVSYKPSYPIFITTDVSTPVKSSQLTPFIKISHTTRNMNDNSSRSESIYKLIAFVPAENGSGYPVYVKINSKGYHIKGGYDFYEYGKDIYDPEYVPNIYSINNQIKSILDNKEAWEARYGKGFARIADLMSTSIELFEGYRQTENYGSVDNQIINDLSQEQIQADKEFQSPILSEEQQKEGERIKKQCKGE